MDELGDAQAPRLAVDLAHDEDGSPLVRLVGELDLNTAPEANAKVEALIRRSPDRLVVDIGGLQFADSSGIALWVSWANAVGDVELREPSEILRRVIERMGLAERLRMTP